MRNNIYIPTVRENLLIIAPSVPRFDRSSGDLRLYSIVEILARDYDITFLATRFKNGDEIYVSQLTDWGVAVAAPDTSLAALLQAKKFSIAIIEFYSIAQYYLPRLRVLQPHCRVVVDSVDVHFLRERMKAETTGNERDYAKAEKTRQEELAVYRKADLVLTVTADDAQILEKECPGQWVGVVPNIHLLESNGKTASPDGPLIFVGNFNHDPNVDAVLFFVREVLPLIWESAPRVRFTVVGINPPPAVTDLACDRIEITGFVPATAPFLRASSISVAPLRYGAGMKGKIGEAMAHGVPVVTTSVGAQGMGLSHGKNVMIADAPQDFASSVLDLLSDRELHSTLTSNALQHIENNYTPVRVAGRLNGYLRELLAVNSRKMTLLEKGTFYIRYALDKL